MWTSDGSLYSWTGSTWSFPPLFFFLATLICLQDLSCPTRDWLNLGPWQCKRWILTAGPPGTSSSTSTGLSNYPTSLSRDPLPLVGLYVLLTYPSCSEAQKIQKELWEAGERLVEGERGTGGESGRRMGPWGQETPLARGALNQQALKVTGWVSDQVWEALYWFAQPPENTGGPTLISLICVLGLEHFLEQEAHYFWESSGWKKILVFHIVFASASRSKFYQFKKRWFAKELKIYIPWAPKGGT